MNLRDYQTKVIDEITQVAVEGAKKIVVQLPCAGGKTVLVAKIISHAVANKKKCLFLVHRRELIYQSVDKLKNFGVEAGVILSDHAENRDLPAQVASIQTLHRRGIKGNQFYLPPADLVIVDEIHHILSSQTWQELLACYPDAYIVGLTATPISRNGVGFGNFFDRLILGPTIQELTEQGHLVPVKHYAPTVPDLKGIKISQGDYNEKQLEKRMDSPKLIGDILENWSLIAKNKKTIVFGSGVKHSIHIAESFNKIGVSACHIDGKTPKETRDKLIEKFNKGEIQVLSNCLIFQEGFDCPSASALVFARPTKSLLLYLQVAGRILRPSPGKEHAIILDHAGAIYEHGRVDQNWPWKLSYGKKKFISKFMPKVPKEKRFIVCGNCKLSYSGRLICPECGWKPIVKGKEIETLDGYLQEIDSVKNPVPDRSLWWRGLKGYCESKGYNEGWAAHKFKEKFGVWPSYQLKSLPAMEPEADVKAWLRHLFIKWAKSKNNPDYTPKQKVAPVVSQMGFESDTLALTP